jgi:putative effector of murein hydrolase
MLKALKLERTGEPLLPVTGFLLRMLRTLLMALLFISIFLVLGVLGYHYFQGLGWIDSLLNAAMILSGMGPVDAPKETAGKLFASFYALMSGVVFISTAGIIIAPIAHRVLHLFHAEDEADELEEEKEEKA